MSLSDLIAQREALDRQIRDAQNASKQQAVAEVRRLMAEHGLTAADLTAKTPVKVGVKSGAKVAAKYRDPASGQTWTGRGLKPKWLATAIAGGKTIDEFVI